MSPSPVTLGFCSKTLLTLGLSVLALTPRTNAWLLEFWSGQEDCNYKIKNNGNHEAADTSRGNPDSVSNNCMMMSYDPDADGLKAMRVTDWTEDCVIALWSSAAGSPPCQAGMPYGISSTSRKPDQVFTINSSDVSWASDESFACISPLNDFVQSNSGFLGYVAYSCGGNATMLVEEYENDLDGDQMGPLIRSLTAFTTATDDTDATETATVNSSITSTAKTTGAPASTTTTQEVTTPTTTKEAATPTVTEETIVTSAPTTTCTGVTSAPHTTFKTKMLPQAPH